MKTFNKQTLNWEIWVMAVIAFLLIVNGTIYAKKEKPGATLVVQKKDGQTIEGELLSVKDGTLRLLIHENASKADVQLNELTNLCIVKNGNGGITLLIGTGAGVVTGVLFGLAQGDDSPGLFSRTAEEKAKICGLIFGSIGTVIGCVHVAFNNKDETIKLDGANQVILLSVEARLASMSRYKTIQHGI